MKWGNKYPADYVNTLYSMVNRNMSRPFRFICLTDDPSGIEAPAETFPIPELSINLEGPERGWKKLSVFSKELYNLSGRVLCLDLDLIITGPLDDLFDHPGDVLIIRDWLKKDGTGNSSVYRFNVGAHSGDDIFSKSSFVFRSLSNSYVFSMPVRPSNATPHFETHGTQVEY